MASLVTLNDYADYWRTLGFNVFPADTRRKTTNENWSQWQDKQIPDEIHEEWKQKGDFNNGMAIITGPIYRGQFKGKVLVAIDLDNKKAIDEFCGVELEYLKQHTIVEQTSNPDKMHIYFIVERKISNKSSNKTDIELFKKIDANEMPALEVKSNGKGIMFCSDSPHMNGSNYQIIGTKTPQVFEASMVEERISLVCQKYNIPYGFNNLTSSNNSIPIADLFKPEIKILKGHNRHEAILRIMESLLQRNRRILPLDEIKELAKKRNQELCVPSLDDSDFEKQWRSALKFIEKKSSDDYDEKEHSFKSHAEIIVKLALESSKLFKNEFEQPHILLLIDNHYEVLSVDGSKFEGYLSKLFYDKQDKQVANAESINNAITTLKAKAIFEGQTIPLHLRVAWSNDKNVIYYDLSDKKRRYIKISKDEGWEIADNQTEVLFKRFGHQSQQVEPLHDYDPLILDKFVNSLNIKNDKHKLLVKVWVVSSLIPGIAIPMLLPWGEKGSAKSTLLRKIKMLIDPSSLDLFSITHRKEEFIQQLSHHYLCFYDNVRTEPGWLSDEVCRAVTGAAHSKRKLYSDDDDIPYRYKKILAFAGINVIFTEPDALDRSIKIELERILEEENIPDTKIEDELRQLIPGLLGYIFDVLSKALELKDSIQLNRLPRMGDFAGWGEAISRAMGCKPLKFINAYFENIGEQNIEIIEAYPFADAISKFIDYERRSWISSPGTFIHTLKSYADNHDIDSSKFPKNATAVSRRLNKIKSNLREGLGIEAIIERTTTGNGKSRSKNTAIIKIRKIAPLPPLPPPDQNDEGIESGNGGGIQTSGDNAPPIYKCLHQKKI